MAISYQSDNVSNTGTTSPASDTHTLGVASGNNRLVIAGVGSEGTATHGTATYNGENMTLAVSAYEGSGAGTRVSIYYILDADLPSSTGSYTVSCPISGTLTSWGIGAASFTGVNQAVPDDTNSSNTTVSGADTLSHDVTVSVANSLIIDAACFGNPDGLASFGSGTFLWFLQPTSAGTYGNYEIVTPTGTSTRSISCSQNIFRIALASAVFAPATEGNPITQVIWIPTL